MKSLNSWIKKEKFTFLRSQEGFITQYMTAGLRLKVLLLGGVTDYIQRMVSDMLFVEFMVSLGDVVEQFREIARYEG